MWSILDEETGGRREVEHSFISVINFIYDDDDDDGATVCL